MKVIKYILIFPIVFIFFGLIFTELNKMYWDKKTQSMCDKGAGLTIYERVVVSKKQSPSIKFSPRNTIIFPLEGREKEGDLFFRRYEHKDMSKWLLKIVKHQQSIVRRSDGKVLGARISYSRVGGDFPLGFEQSYFSCGRNVKDILLLNSVVSIEEN